MTKSNVVNHKNFNVIRSPQQMTIIDCLVGMSKFLNHRMVLNLKVLALAIMLPLTQCSTVYAHETSTSNMGAANLTHNHNETPNYINDASHALASINPQIVNPSVDISSILHSVVESSLNLNSVLHNVNSGHLVQDVTLIIGNHNLEVGSNQALTPAEAIALSQVLSTNHQTLVLDALGQGVGGSLNTSSLGSQVNNLEVSSGVTLVDNSKTLILTGNLANYGDIVFGGSGNLQANNILNEGSGLISSSGTLGITTNALINEGGIYGANGVNINAPVVYNAGTVESALGNINIANANMLDVTGTQNSVFEANNGNINIDVNATSLSQGMNLAYGNYLSNELNLNAGNGFVQGVTGNVSGQININANSAHLATASKDMLLGNDLVNGDPTYVNLLGDISLNGAVTTNGNNLAIIANGNINVATGGIAAYVNTGSSTANSGNVVMIAGVGTNVSGGSVNSSTIPVGGSPATSTVTVSLGSATGNTGGNIDLVSNNNLATSVAVINTASAFANGNGGNVTLLAQSNGSSGGEVITSAGTINYGIVTGGNGTGNNGNVTVIGTANSGTGVSLGYVTTTGGGGTGGDVSIYTANPSVQSVAFDTTGSTASIITANTASLSPSSIALNGNIITSSGNGIITINSGAGITSGTNLLSGASLVVNAVSGDFGAFSSNVQTNVGALTLTINGSAYITDNASLVTVNNSSVGSISNFELIMNNATAGSIDIVGLVTAGADNGTGTIILTTSGAGTINTSGAGNVAQAGTLILNTSGGDIGNNSQFMQIDTSNLSLNTLHNGAITGNAYLINANLQSTSLNTSTIGNNSILFLETTGGIVVNGLVAAGGISNFGTINLNVQAGTITSSGSGSILQAGGEVLLNTAGGNIGSSSQAVLTNTSNLNIGTLNSGSTTGSAYVTNSNPGGVTLLAGSVAANGVLQLTSAGNIVIDNTITAGTDTGTGTINLIANGSGSITTQTIGQFLQAGNVNLTTNGSDIGSLAQGFQVDASNVGVTTGGVTGNAFIQDAQASTTVNITITQAIVGVVSSDTFGFSGVNSSTSSILTGSGVTVHSPNVIIASVNGNIGLSGQVFALNSTGITLNATSNSVFATDSASGNIVFNTVTAQGHPVTNAVAMNGGGTYQFTDTSNGNLQSGLGVGVISGNFVSLTSALGAVGNNVNVLNVDANNLNVSAGTDSYISNSSVSVNLNGVTVGVTNTFSLTSSGNVVVNGVVSAGADSGSGTIDLNTTSTGTISTTLGSLTDILTAGNVNLSTNGSDVGSISQGLLVDANNVGVTTGGVTGNAFVQDASGNNIIITQGLVGSVSTDTFGFSGVNSSTTGINTATGVTITAPNMIVVSVNGNIGTGSGLGATFNVNSNNVSFMATSNSVYVNDNASGLISLDTITAQGQTVTNAADMNGGGTYYFNASNSTSAGNLLTGSGASISGNNVNLNSDLGYVGSSTNALAVIANNLSTNAGTDSYLNDSVTTSVNLNASNVGSSNTLNLTASGAVIVNGLVTAGSDSSTGTINIFASGTISTLTGSTSDLLVAGSVNLNTSSNGSDIGSINQGLMVDANSVGVTTGGVTGNAYVEDVSANNITITQAVVGIVSTDTFGFSGVNSSTTSLTTGSGVSITAPNILVASVNGNIGTGSGSAQTFNVDSSNVTFNATSNSVYVNDSASGIISFNNVTAQSQNVTNAADLNGGGTYYFNASNATTAGNLITSPGANISAKYVDLTSALGSIGSSTNNISVNAANLSLNAGSDAYANDTAASVNLNASSVGATNTLQVLTPGNLNVSGAIAAGSLSGTGTVNLTVQGGSNITQTLTNGTITAGNVNLTTSGGSITTSANIVTNNLSMITTSGGGIAINSKVGAITGTTTLNANGTGYITTGTGGLVIGNSLNMTSTGGEIGFGVGGLQPLLTQANSLMFNAGLSVGILNATNNLSIGTSVSGANVYVENSGNMVGTGTITAPVVGLYSFSGSSGIGSASSLMQINAHNIGLESYGSGSSVYVNDTYTGSTVMQASQAINIFKLNTNGPLTIYAQIDQNGVVTPGIIGGTIIAIQTQSGYGIYNDASIQASDFIFLTASQTGYIAEPATGALMIAPNISLVSGGGAIGAGGRLLLNSGLVAASTQGLNSFVNIYDEATNSGIVGGQSGSSFTFNTNGNVNVIGSVATGAGVKANGGAINISGNGLINIGTTSGINVTTNNGPIVVQDNNTASGVIQIAKGDYIYTNTPVNTAGYVVFNIGNYTQVNNSNPNPVNITVQSSGGASVYFGTHGIATLGGGNVLNAKGQSIVFNTGALSANAITLGGSLSITADPPVAVVASSGVVALQNNVALLGLAGANGNAQAGISQSTVNVLDNNQATLNTNSLNSDSSQNPDSGYLGYNNIDNNEMVANTSIYMPISYKAEVSDVAISQTANSIMNLSHNAKANGRSLNLNEGSDNVALAHGSAIIRSSHDLNIVLGTKNPIQVKLKRGAIVLAIANGNVVSVYNLHDNAASSVVIKANDNKLISLTPGHQATLAKINQSLDFAYVNQVSKIGYRAIKAVKEVNYVSYTSDFSIPSAIIAIKPLKAMFASSNRKVKAIAQQLLKTSVVVTQSTSGSGVYEQVTKPKLTAMN